MRRLFAQFALGLAVASGAALPLAAKKPIDAFGVSDSAASSGGMNSVARRAKDIVATNRALRVASTVCAKANRGDGEDRGHADIVAEYGRSLKGPLAWIIRQPILFDASVLPYDKKTIKAALIECARQRALSADEIEALGDLHFYLSYFIEGMKQRDEEPGSDFFAEQRSEGAALRSAWHEAIVSRKQSKFSQFLPSWLKPYA
jgi:hypothetical protein